MNISVVVPVRNTKAEYLNQCLTSITAQTYQPFEVIVVDGESDRKETLNALNEWEKKGVKVIHQKNKYISGALNTGIRNMKGDWWAGCASDDLWFPIKLAEQIKFSESKPEAKVIYANWLMIDSNGFFMRQINEPEFFSLKDQQQFLRRGYFGTWSNLLIHKSVFEKVGLFNEEYPTCEDYEFNIRLAQFYLFYKVPKNLMMYRIHIEQLSQTPWGYGGENGKAFNQKAKELAEKLFG